MSKMKDDSCVCNKLYNKLSIGLYFFTGYELTGWLDIARFGFANKFVSNETIKIFNYGNCKMDFTYIDDIVEGVVCYEKAIRKEE